MTLLRPDASQVVTWTQQYTSPRWLGQIGHVTGLKYSFACPGGADQMSCLLAVDATLRTNAMDPGRIVQIIRGGSLCWDGKLLEPIPSSAGWQISAIGSGNAGTDFDAHYTSTWPGSQPDQPINNAISRGLRWVNPGLNSGPYSGQYWLSAPVDSSAQTITDLLNLLCTNGGLTWYVTTGPIPGQASPNTLSLFPLPVTPTRRLVSNTPVPRTLGGDVNTVWLRYEVSADNTTTGAAAVYADVAATNAASVALHGPMEIYADLSSAGVMSSGSAQAIGNAVLQRYQRASFAGPFTVQPGQLLTLGGTPVDLGAEQAGGVCQLILTDFAYGGELSPAPISFLVGGYEYDDDTQAATITPFQSLSTNFSSLLSAAVTMLPAAAATTTAA